MKERKNTLIQTDDQFQEKTTFEKIEDEVKETIFNVLYVLLKDDEVSSQWSYMGNILFDYIQIFHFSFDSIMEFPWKSDGLLHYIQLFMDFFKIPYWIAQFNFPAYLAIFYVFIVLVVLVILDIIYVSYSFTKKKFAFVWPLQILRTICSLFVTALFLPILETFTIMIDCHEHEGHQILRLFPEEECWHGPHIVHATLAIVISAIFMMISMIVSLTYFESKGSTSNIASRVNSRADTFLIFMKIVLMYMYSFFVGPENHWLVISALLIFSIGNYYNYRMSWPFYSDQMNKFMCILSGLFVFGNVCLFIAKVFESANFSGTLQIYFLGLPLYIVLIYYDKDERVKLLLKNINNFEKGEEIALQIRYFIYLVQTHDNDRKNAIILQGYIYHHEDFCPLPECQLKKFKLTISEQNRTKKKHKKQNLSNVNQLNQKILLRHARNMYRTGIQRFPNCTPLKIQYAFFLMDTLGKKKEGSAELQQTLLQNPPFDEQFIIYRCQQMNEDYGENGANMSIVAKFAFDSSLLQCQQHILRAASLHLQFWNNLANQNPDILKLDECGQKFNNSIAKVDKYWNILQKLNSKVPHANILYAKFLIEIRNDKEGGKELLERVKDSNLNFFEGNLMHDDMQDINSITQDGTPSIFVSGESDQLGTIVQCNAGACTLFGYSPNEMKNYNVDKLMPDMYAKNHRYLLEGAARKGTEGILKNERLIFGRHKSGYIFPIWICLRMFTNTQGQIQLVAIFKTDKNLVSQDIAYILLNQDKNIEGITSSCINLMNLDISKIHKLARSKVQISQLTPQLFHNENENNFMNKNGAIIDWYVPNFERLKHQRKKLRKNQYESNQLTEKEENLKKVRMANLDMNERAIDKDIFGDKTIQFHCNLNIVTMAEFGEIGWCIKLESIQPWKQTNNDKKCIKEKDWLKQPLFQFRFNPFNGKYIREIKENSHVNNAFQDQSYLSQVFGIKYGDLVANEEESKVDIQEINLEEMDTNRVMVQKEVAIDLFEKKKQWASGIKTYRLVNGKFRMNDQQDQEINQLELIKEENKKKKEQVVNENEMENYKDDFKSRKALLMAIKDKSTPPVIVNLRLISNLAIVAILAISIIEFSLVTTQFQDINENFNLIQQSYGRLSEIQRVAYDVRTLIMINEKRLTSYKNYVSNQDFVSYLRSDIEESLNSLYDLQNAIQQSTIKNSNEQQKLIDHKSVMLHFRNRDNTIMTIKYSLPEAVMQMASAIYSARYLNISSYTDNQEDLFFITYNTFNDFYEKIQHSSHLYTEDLNIRASYKRNLILILFLASIGTLTITQSIFLQLLSNVNKARMNILSLFVDIPHHKVIALANKCEKFLDSLDEEQNEIEINSEDNDNLQKEIEKEDMPQNYHQSHRTPLKQPKNIAGSIKKILMQFGIPTTLFLAYFIITFTISTNSIDDVQIITSELSLLAQAEPFYSLAENVQREMIYNKDKQIFGQDSQRMAIDIITQVTKLNIKLMENHSSQSKNFKEEFKTLFTNIYENNLCNQDSIYQLDLIAHDCETFIEQAARHGLQTILVKYFETLKATLVQYFELKSQKKSLNPLINNVQMEELYIMQYRFIQQSFRNLIDNLKHSTNKDFNAIVDFRMAAFIVFVIALSMAYLIVWIPFVRNLSSEIWRTKNMLTIIPIDVIFTVPRIQEFLHSQKLLSNYNVK